MSIPWKFTHFISKRYLFHEKWERDNKDLLEEIMLISECIDPITGNSRMEKSTHYGSRNAFYHYKKTRTKKNKLKENLSDSLIRMSGKEPKPEKVVENPPVVELALKALNPKMPKTIQEYDKELLEDESGVEDQAEQIGKHE